MSLQRSFFVQNVDLRIVDAWNSAMLFIMTTVFSYLLFYFFLVKGGGRCLGL